MPIIGGVLNLGAKTKNNLLSEVVRLNAKYAWPLATVAQQHKTVSESIASQLITMKGCADDIRGIKAFVKIVVGDSGNLLDVDSDLKKACSALIFSLDGNACPRVRMGGF